MSCFQIGPGGSQPLFAVASCCSIASPDQSTSVRSQHLGVSNVTKVRIFCENASVSGDFSGQGEVIFSVRSNVLVTIGLSNFPWYRCTRGKCLKSCKRNTYCSEKSRKGAPRRLLAAVGPHQTPTPPFGPSGHGKAL